MKTTGADDADSGGELVVPFDESGVVESVVDKGGEIVVDAVLPSVVVEGVLLSGMRGVDGGGLIVDVEVCGHQVLVGCSVGGRTVAPQSLLDDDVRVQYFICACS